MSECVYIFFGPLCTL